MNPKMIKYFLIMVLISAVTITSCKNPADNEPINNSPKSDTKNYRLVSQVVIENSLIGPVTYVYSYNVDGSLEQVDYCNSEGYIFQFIKYTNDLAGRRIKEESYYYNYEGEAIFEYMYEYKYDKNILISTQSIRYLSDRYPAPELIFYNEYTFSNGNKIKEEYFINDIKIGSRTFLYDNSGKRISTKYEEYNAGSITSIITGTRTYRSNGTLEFVAYSNGNVRTFEWEEKETLVDYDTYFSF